MPDGLVIIDKQFFSEFNDDLLYSLEIYLDVNGDTELVCDFDEEWSSVRERESALIRKYINSSKLIVILSNRNVENCEILIEEKNVVSEKKLKVPSGNLILVKASELIQCLAYPELDMEEIIQFDVVNGLYSVEYNDMKKITLSYIESIEEGVDGII